VNGRFTISGYRNVSPYVCKEFNLEEKGGKDCLTKNFAGSSIKSVINCNGFEHMLPLRSTLRYPLSANLQTWKKKGQSK